MTHKFSVGDHVRVVKKVNAKDGWGDVWTSDMDGAIGMEFIVERHFAAGVFFEEDEDHADLCMFLYPPSSLELVMSATTKPVQECVT